VGGCQAQTTAPYLMPRMTAVSAKKYPDVAVQLQVQQHPAHPSWSVAQMARWILAIIGGELPV